MTRPTTAIEAETIVSPGSSSSRGRITTLTTTTAATNLPTPTKSLESNKSMLEVVKVAGNANAELMNLTKSHPLVQADDRAKFVYSAENTTNDTVKIVLSTLSPKFPLGSPDIGKQAKLVP